MSSVSRLDAAVLSPSNARLTRTSGRGKRVQWAFGRILSADRRYSVSAAACRQYSAVICCYAAFTETCLAEENSIDIHRRSAPCTRHPRSCRGRRTSPQTTQLSVWAASDWLAGEKADRPHLCLEYCDYLAPLQRHPRCLG